ncbi:carotenoid oxygenase family protein [Catenulispora sp. NL8]|uniref:Dioxygenase n=1 Tax=Catenulispora pinistramenti TaxID=2705254 RepID=A0ABS5KXN4_9ACTN|nr:carotenoid oxygenase family protein [Catenulispora pinistramenti]MBS2550789.1 carotenoid oxygenase family protein [Catenulispora pinistramenti]
MALPDPRTAADTGRGDIKGSGSERGDITCGDIDCSALPVKGAVPPELDGTLFRIGPQDGQPYVSALRLRHGGAEWFRARRIRTDEVCRQTGELPSPGPRRCASDVTAAAVIRHNRRTLALGDGALPYELAPDLRTRARWDFDGTLPSGFTSQAVHDPLTGELFAAVAGPRTLDYVVIDVHGSVRGYEPIPTPCDPRRYVFALTDRHAVFAGPAGVGIMPREGGARDVVWVGTPGTGRGPGPAHRPVNAFDLRGGGVAVDTVGADTVGVDTVGVDTVGAAGSASAPGLWRWRVEPGAGGGVRGECLSRPAQDLAGFDERYRGSDHRYALTRRLDAGRGRRPGGIGLLRHDLAAGTTEQHGAKPGRLFGAPVFVPYSPTAPEGHGWVLVSVRDIGQERDEVIVIDTADFAGPPVATVELPGTGPREASACWQVADPW